MNDASLRERRKRLGKTLYEMSTITRLDLTTISRMERGTVDPKKSNYDAYVNALDALERKQVASEQSAANAAA